MKTSSAKAKGRNLQKWVVTQILSLFPSLTGNDVSSRSMGAQGEDVLLSEAARKLLPVSFECKNRAAFAVYKDYVQAETNSQGYEPIQIIKQNHCRPLAIIDAELLLVLLYEKTKSYSQESKG